MVLALIPVVLLAVSEAALRLAGQGGHAPLFREIGAAAGGLLVEVDWRGSQSYFFNRKPGRGACHQQSFLMPKPPGVVRIFLAGESAIQGFPQPLPLSAGAFLEAMLEDAWPGRDVEVINLGTTAVASFAVADMVKQALRYAPDLVIVYAGNNEFFGAYGVSSQHYAGSHPRILRLTRALHGLAVVQWVAGWRPPVAEAPDSLMEGMMREQQLAPESRLRARAADLLEAHITRMARAARAAGVPLMVCSLACNERDLAPIGGGAAALAAFEAAQTALAAGRVAEAAADFQRAIDLDLQPWRPTTPQQEVLRRVAQEPGVWWCDVRAAFRAESPGGLIGWELMDDHVHPSLAGQCALARAMVERLATVPGVLQVPASADGVLDDCPAYAARLGANPYDALASGMTMLSLFRNGIFRVHNSAAAARWQERVGALAAALPREVALRLQTRLREEALSRGSSPVSALAAEVLVELGRYADAEPLFRVACRAVPPYAPVRRQYGYWYFWCRQQVNGALSAADRAGLRDEILRGDVLLRYGESPSGRAEYYMGKCWELLGDTAQAQRLLARAAEKQRSRSAEATPDAAPVAP